MANGMLTGGIVVVIIIIAAGAYFVLSNHGTSTSATTTVYSNTTTPTTVVASTTTGTSTTGTTSASTTPTTTVATTTISSSPSYVPNGNFSTGTYANWTVNGTGFGKTPLNVKTANADLCYIGGPWTNYNGTYFATTFTCGTQVTTGNLTSGYFTASEPYLNFRIISQASSGLYVEILYNGVPKVISHYNTYNSSNGADGSYTFYNASMPLTSVQGDAVQVRVVAATLQSQSFIAIGDFVIAQNANQAKGILLNTTT